MVLGAWAKGDRLPGCLFNSTLLYDALGDRADFEGGRLWSLCCQAVQRASGSAPDVSARGAQYAWNTFHPLILYMILVRTR